MTTITVTAPERPLGASGTNAGGIGDCCRNGSATIKATPHPPQYLFVEGFTAEQSRHTTLFSVEPVIELSAPGNGKRRKDNTESAALVLPLSYQFSCVSDVWAGGSGLSNVLRTTTLGAPGPSHSGTGEGCHSSRRTFQTTNEGTHPSKGRSRLEDSEFTNPPALKLLHNPTHRRQLPFAVTRHKRP